MDDGGEDLISLLPDCVLGEIVTLLPTLEAARVPVLSSRWRRAWRSSPLKIDLANTYTALVSTLLAVHPGPARRFKLTGPISATEKDYNHWFRLPALDGLQVLELLSQSQHVGCYDCDSGTGKHLPRTALRFAPTLRILKLRCFTFPSANALCFPQLELLSFHNVEISEPALHAVLGLGNCPTLRTLVLGDCTGFVRVRINSSTITSLAIAAEARLKQVLIIEDAPLLEKLVPFRHWGSVRGLELHVISAPKLRVLGSMSKALSKLELGATIFEQFPLQANGYHGWSPQEFTMLRSVRIQTMLQTVKVLALEDSDTFDIVCNFMRCFPRLQKLYVSTVNGYKSTGTYDKLNPIECFEQSLKKVVLKGFRAQRSDIKFAKLFVTRAQVLELLTLRCHEDYQNGFETEKEFNAYKKRELHVMNQRSQHLKIHFVRDQSNQQVYFGRDIDDMSEHIHHSSRDAPFAEWFEPEGELMLW